MADGALPQIDVSSDHIEGDPPRALTLASHQMSELIEQDELSVPAMRAIMWNTHGGSDAEGAWNWRAAYDCAEAGLLLAIKRDPEFDLSSPDAVLRQIGRTEKLLASMPTQTRRSEDQMRMQQFSTPLPLAVLMVAAADFGQSASDRTASNAAHVSGLTVLEPSAGCGALAMLAQKAGCAVSANELDPSRRALCAQVLDQDVSTEDAEFIQRAVKPRPSGRGYKVPRR